MRGLRAPRKESTTEQGRTFYDSRYLSVKEKRRPYHLQPYYGLWCIIADRVRHCGGVLEVGCGAGHLAALLSAQGIRSYEGFDFSPAAIEIARAQTPSLTFHVADAFTTKLFDTARYDTIICTEVLEHIDRDRELITRWPAGVRCLCSVPDFPGKAHVRHFESADEVSARYGDLFVDVTVATVVRASERFARFFLFDGYRRSW